jgi:hypothetical protein
MMANQLADIHASCNELNAIDVLPRENEVAVVVGRMWKLFFFVQLDVARVLLSECIYHVDKMLTII